MISNLEPWSMAVSRWRLSRALRRICVASQMAEAMRPRPAAIRLRRSSTRSSRISSRQASGSTPASARAQRGDPELRIDAPGLQRRQARGQRGRLAPRPLDFAKPRRRDVEMPSRAAAALGRGLADVGPQQASRFQPIQRRIDRARRDRPAGALEDLGANRRAVGLAAEPENREYQQLFELAQVVSRHIVY